MKVGILFGGPSREREIAFAGGRTVYDNLDKVLFEPIPIFVDSQRNFILLDWQYIYKGTIRDFYPPVEALPHSEHDFQIYIESLGELTDDAWERLISKVGCKISIEELPDLIDIAFLALHGQFGEDGQIQGLLESLQVPYTGSGIRGCTIGMDKAFQKKIMETAGFATPEVQVLHRKAWINADKTTLFEQAKEQIGFPMVIRPANQGSSIGVAIVAETASQQDFEYFINRAFFREKLLATKWQNYSKEERVEYVRGISDIRDGLGFPMNICIGNKKIARVIHPEDLLVQLDVFIARHGDLFLESHWSEQRVIVESFIHGKEFSCIVLRQEDGTTAALPPTEIIKGSEVFDYRSKYLPGLSRKETPIKLPNTQINEIRKECRRLFEYLEFNTYARIDGFINDAGTIFLNDPNTTSGMLPSSFFFHQSAEIGLNPSQFITYIIRASLQERIATLPELTHFDALLQQLDTAIEQAKNQEDSRKKIAVILGGYSAERHISVESGRNIFEKLASSNKYEPIPIYLIGDADSHELYQIPINLLLKDNADDIRDKILGFEHHPILEEIREECSPLIEKYASTDVVFEPRKITYTELAELVDGVFIALHGRPGEDGEVQLQLTKFGIPYNGSDSASSRVTINKFNTLQLLKRKGFTVAHQRLLSKAEYESNPQANIAILEGEFAYPFIMKPVDDGCSAAVKVIKNREQLQAFCNLMFRETLPLPATERTILDLQPKEEFPIKAAILVEELITAKGAKHFLEITGGLLTHHKGDAIRYEMFEPSEALASGEILSLEEKFLAGEGQNITPARYSPNKEEYDEIASQVKATLQEAAEILGIKGYARIDAFVRVHSDNRAETIIIEANSLPGMTPATCIYHQAAINGYKPYDFIDKILEFGFEERAAMMVEGE